MTPDDLRVWQSQMGYTYDTAAAALGVSRATYARYLQGGAPLVVALACAALVAGIKPFSALH